MFGISSAMTLAVGTAQTTAGLAAALLSIIPSAGVLAWGALRERARRGRPRLGEARSSRPALGRA